MTELSPRRNDKRTRPINAPGTALLGFALAVAASVAVYFGHPFVFERGLAAAGIRPDFQGNGINWILIGLDKVDLTVLPIFFVLLFAVVMPSLYVRAKKVHGVRIPALALLFGVIAVEFLLCLFLIGWSGTHIILAMTAAPILLITAVLLLPFTWFLNSTLRH